MTAQVDLHSNGVLGVRLQRPAQRNALNGELLTAVNQGIGPHLRAGGVHALVLQGDGGYFSAGADLQEMAEARAAGDEGRRRLRVAMNELVYLMTELRTLDLPTVALVEGGASGGGVGLLGSCQWVVARRDAKFRLPEAQIGLFPFMISPVLIRRMGLAGFLQMTFAGRAFGAAEAQQMGLVDELVDELPAPEEAASRAARPQSVWPEPPEPDAEAAGRRARAEEEALQAAAQAPPLLQRAARTAALLHRSMSLPIAMRTAAIELGALIERQGDEA
jgi:methylglutaconyl-CoA hydratase